MLETRTRLKTRLAIVSTYAPRRCGIATFAQDVTTALAEAAPDLAVEICALDRDSLEYPAEVSTVIDQVHALPVNLHLCAASGDWPWSSIHAYEDRIIIPWLFRKQHQPSPGNAP